MMQSSYDLMDSSRAVSSTLPACGPSYGYIYAMPAEHSQNGFLRRDSAYNSPIRPTPTQQSGPHSKSTEPSEDVQMTSTAFREASELRNLEQLLQSTTWWSSAYIP